MNEPCTPAHHDVLMLVKETSYERFILRKKDKKTQSLLNQNHPSVSSIQRTYEEHKFTCDKVLRLFTHYPCRLEVRELNRELNIDAKFTLVITLGGDGTFLTASHKLSSSVELLGINSAPSTSIGFFCAGTSENVAQLIELALQKKIKKVHLTRMKVLRNHSIIHSRVLNEALFSHVSPAATTKYRIGVEKKEGRVEESQKSSGVWIGPAPGSTSAMRSAGGDILPLQSTDLQYVVREAYVPIGKEITLKKGRIKLGESLSIVAGMRKGKLFIDGSATEFSVELGDHLSFLQSDDGLTVLGLGG